MGLPVESNGVSVEPAAPCSAPKRTYVTYNAVHDAIVGSKEQLKSAGWGSPDYLVAIAGGGLIPARVLRSVLRSGHKGCATIKVVGLELYNDEFGGKAREEGVVRTQWLEASTPLVGKRILIVDEVDDSRQTLAFAVKELQADIAAQEAELEAAGQPVPPTHLAVFVIHCKQRTKAAELPAEVPEFVAQEVEGDPWIVYPWDAPDIEEHERLADQN